MRAARPAPSMLVLLAAGLACAGCTDREQEEARVVIDRVEAIDPSADAEELRSQVEALEKLELSDESIRATRDRCLDAHRALLTAEEEQATAKEVAGSLERVGGDDGELGPEDAEDLIGQLEKSKEGLEALERSNDAIAEARELLPKCQDDIVALKAEHGRRRGE